MKTTLTVLCALALSAPTAAQDRASENRAAVRRAFPIVSLFDRKKPNAVLDAAEPSTAEKAAATVAATAGDMQSLATAPGDARDVAGIRIGMTPDQVAAAAVRSGYRREEVSTQQSWASRVRQEEGMRGLQKLYPAQNAEVPGSETYGRSGSQKVHVVYTSTPRGQFVYSVRYSVSMTETTWESMMERTRAKYGRPGHSTASTLVFCLPGETRCDSFGLYVLPNVVLDMLPGASWLTLSQGSRYRQAYGAALVAEIDRLHPKNERPAF